MTSAPKFLSAHHLTMGEGGAVNIVKDQKLKMVVKASEIGDATVGALQGSTTL